MELLKKHLWYFEQTELPLKGLLSNKSMEYNTFLLLHEYLMKQIPYEFGKSKMVREIQSLVNRSFSNTRLLLHHLEEDIKKFEPNQSGGDN